MPVEILIVALFGLAFGSFLNVCIYRLPRGESIVKPRSHCPGCGALIHWYDNIPILSYALLRGRCRRCGARIPLVYPAVEVLTALACVAAFLVFGPSLAFLRAALFSMLLIVLIFTDLNERRIPHAVTLFGMAVGVASSLIVPVDSRPLSWLLEHYGFQFSAPALSFLGSLSGAALGGGLFYAVGAAFYHLRKKEGLGFGDVMLMLMIGTYLGVWLTLLTILLGSLLGSFVAAPLELFTRRFHRYPWPYGSFLGAAGIYAALGGENLIHAYLRWSGLG